MKPLNLISTGAFVLLAACSNPENISKTDKTVAETSVPSVGDPMMKEDGRPEVPAMGDSIGDATGVIRSLGIRGDFVTIEHGPFTGDIAMEAMTMGFGVMGDVDLSDFEEGDAVAFSVKRGRDGSYRVLAICNTTIEGARCLDTGAD